MEELMYAKTQRCITCDNANGNGRATLQIYQALMGHRIFQGLHGHLRDRRSFHLTRHDEDRRKVTRGPSLEESILNVVDNRPESSKRDVVHCINVHL
ncbi:hypothetical protein TNCV_2234541 [Trichonephila clavipes]|nr:hypothetical protein TNCV_2234541 [Trichonephila clavipes]